MMRMASGGGFGAEAEAAATTTTGHLGRPLQATRGGSRRRLLGAGTAFPRATAAFRVAAEAAEARALDAGGPRT